MQYYYPALFEPEKDGQYTVTFPDLPGCVTQGDNLQDAFRMAIDAATGWVLTARDKKMEVPAASNPDGNGNYQLVPVPVAVRKERVQLTLDDALLEELDRRGVNRSAYINEAVWDRLTSRPG